MFGSCLVYVAALPTTPVNVQQYAPASFLPAGLTSLKGVVPPPPSTTSSAVSMAATAQSIVHNLTQQSQAHHQQVMHQKQAHQAVSYGPAAIRTVSCCY
jgi:hypothetical protein